MDSILTYLLENWPYAIWISIGGFIVYMYYRLKKHSEEAKNIASSTDDRLNRLPCESHAMKVNKIDAIDAKIDGMMQMLQMMPALGGRNIVQAQSPVNLTDFGRSLMDELKIEESINNNWEAIFSYLENNSMSMNPYDIQQLCFNYVLLYPSDVLGDIVHDNVKKKAYNLGVPSINVLQGAAILIRDRYFKDHGINIDDVDKHDPQKSPL